jgi:predicted SnoaL-like aldol condensation-catalyzing enzyme
MSFLYRLNVGNNAKHFGELAERSKATLAFLVSHPDKQLGNEAAIREHIAHKERARKRADLSAARQMTTKEKTKMNQSLEEKNKSLVLEAFDTLFNRRDYASAEKFWSPKYIQHSAHIEPGRDGLFDLIKSLPSTLKYESGTITAEGDFVIVHGRFSNFGLPVNWIAADIVRIENGVLAERWDVIQDEAPREQSKSGLPMFGSDFPN